MAAIAGSDRSIQGVGHGPSGPKSRCMSTQTWIDRSGRGSAVHRADWGLPRSP
jgi:hypothetical protein